MSSLKAALTASLVSLPALLLPLDANAEEQVCKGTLGAITVDNLRVPPDRTCTLHGTRVKGTLKVERNATLQAYDVIVIGNVQAENAANVRVLQGSRIGGSVQVVQGRAARVADSRVNGDIQYFENDGFLYVLRNYVGGSVQIMSNAGGVDIRRNVIDGNLQCKSNYRRPTGGNNVVEGNKEDQCEDL